MPYKAAKISFDGSHYIATPKENFPQGHKRRRAAIPSTPKEVEQKAQFEAAYKESQKLRAKNAKNVCKKLWKRRSPTRSSGKNTWSGTMNAKRRMQSAEKSVCPRK